MSNEKTAMRLSILALAGGLILGISARSTSAEENSQNPKKQLSTFVLRDVHVRGIWGAGHKVAVQYQYRVEFYSLPKDLFFKQTKGKTFIVRRVGETETTVDLQKLQLKPVATLRFQRPVELLPRWPRTVEQRLLICTSMLNGFNPITDAERARLPSAEREYFEWTDKGAPLDDFCGVVSMDGAIVWKLDYRQSIPDHLLFPVGMSADGNRALIQNGSRVVGDEGSDSVGFPTELYRWEYPNRVTKLRAADYGQNYEDFYDKFQSGKL